MALRPNSIKYFECITLAAYVLGVLRLKENWSQIASNSAALSSSHSGLSVFLIFGGSLLLGIGIVLLISRRGSRIAMWVYVGMTVFGLPFVCKDVFRSEMSFNLAIMLIQTIADVGAIAFLFDPSAKAWMRRSRGSK